MNYRVRRQGEELGVVSLEELRRRREAGELTGGEYVQCEGTADWRPLDLVLQQGYRAIPSPVPPPIPTSGVNRTVVWVAVIGGVFVILLVAVGLGVVVSKFQQGYSSVINQARWESGLNQPRPQAVSAAKKPILWTTNTLTAADAQKRSREFRLRQWVEGYEKRGQRNPECDAEADKFIRVWIARNYGGPEATNTMSFEDESDKLANDPKCTDPLVLTAAADESLNYFDAVHRFERALAAYPGSAHRAYPKFYAAVKLAGQLGETSGRTGELETSALQLLPKCFADGSFTPADQQEIADIFVNGWGYDFFQHNDAAVCAVVHNAGRDYEWLAFTLEGEREIADAWKARGSGYANSVTDAGWQGFREHLKAARASLTQAWNLQPTFPLAPCRMMTVALGDSDIEEMRLWFDRTVAAQVDYPGAWTEMRWGLRPRWYGNEQAMLALGKAAVATHRFDTDVPRKFVDCIYDVESEMGMPAGQHIFGRDDIWPDLQSMYEGYVREAQPYPDSLRDWRTSYAIVSYFAGRYDTARAQFEALGWKPAPERLTAWSADLSLMPLEVAARTGPLGKKSPTPKPRTIPVTSSAP